jgi:hypothetical protein
MNIEACFVPGVGMAGTSWEGETTPAKDPFFPVDIAPISESVALMVSEHALGVVDRARVGPRAVRSAEALTEAHIFL